MKHNLLVFFLLISGLVDAQVKISDLEFDHDHINFGTVAGEGGPVVARYTMVNKGSETFELTGMDVACGCTSPKASKNSAAPGDTIVFTAIFNPFGMVGTVRKWIRIQGNFSDALYKELHFEAEITSKAYTPENSADKYIPGQYGYLLLGKLHVDFGNQVQQFTKRDSIMIYNDGYHTIAIKEVKGLPSYLTLPQLPLSIDPKNGSQLYLEIDASKLDTVGPVSGTFTLITTDKFFPEKQVSYSVDLNIDFDSWKKRQIKNAAHIHVSSTQVDMGTMKSGTVRVKSFTITNSGKSPLIIYRVDTDCACAVLENAQVTIAPGDSVTLNLKFDSVFKKGTQTKAITIYTNDPNQPRMILGVKAVVL